MNTSGPVVFRTGASKQIGFGHLRRCLSLAGGVRRLGADCFFLIDEDPGCVSQLAADGFDATYVKPEEDLTQTIAQCRKWKARAIVADSYALNTAYLAGLRESRAAVAVVDDLADRELPVDLVVNGSVEATKLTYGGAQHTQYLLGPQFVLLRSEFAEEPQRTISERVRRVLITVGGSDREGLTGTLVRWIAESLDDVSIDVVMGPLFEGNDACAFRAPNVTVHRNPENMRGLMLAADLAVSGGGQTTYELAATGTPAVAIRMADNQTRNLDGLRKAGTLDWAADSRDDDLRGKVKTALTALAGNRAARVSQNERGRKLVDGHGARRVAEAIVQLGTRSA